MRDYWVANEGSQRGTTMEHFKVRPLSAAVATILAGISSQGMAQVLDEFVVTAERRETALQQTPISIAAFNADTMELKGLETIEDIATVTPNLDIKGSRGTGNVSPTYQIRGLAGGGGLGERSAAMYIDGVFMPRTTGPYMSIVDVERIEVLRGPQGTLFGRNSTGGAIRVFTKQPGPEFDSYVRLTAGDYDRQDVSAMVNVPLSDTVFFRVQGGSLEQDGYVQRGTQLLGSSEDTLGRLQLAIEPSDSLRVTFGLSSTQSESDGNPQDISTWDMNPTLAFQGSRADWVSDFLALAGQPRLAVFNDQRIVLDDYSMNDWCFIDDPNPDWDAACEQVNESDYTQFDVNLTVALTDRWSFTSITGLSDFESHGRTDWVMLGTEMRLDDVESDVVYQELQFNASWDRFDLVTGMSYFQEDTTAGPGTAGPNYERRGTSNFTTQAANGDAVALGGGPGGLFVTQNWDTPQDAESIGVFANVAWHITDRLTLTPGVRFAYDEKKVTQIRLASDDFIPFGGLPSQVVYAEDDWQDTDWRLTVDYTITEDIMIYATSSQAYRAGAYSYQMPTNPATGASLSSGDAQTAAIAAGTVAAFTPAESVQNNEIGIRSDWFDGRLRVNLTYFDMAYTDRTGPIQVAAPGTPTGFIIQLVNTGDVDLDGFELEGQIAATDNILVDFSAGKVNSLVKDPCANNGDFLFPGPVEDSYSVGGRFMVPMDRGSNLTFGLSYAYTGPQQTHPGATALTCFNAVTGAANLFPNWFFDSRYEQPDYSLVNARVRYASASGNWELSVFANNLTDEVYANYATRFGGGFWDATALRAPPTPAGAIVTNAVQERSALGNTMGRPREYGVTFQYNFGGGDSAD
jgi:iron complex outermembrane receptor protein